MTSDGATRCDTLLRGVVVTMDPERHVYEDGFVAIAGTNIVGVGRASECSFSAPQTIAGDRLIIPGLVNAHAHLVQGCIRGMAEGATKNASERFMGFQFPMSAACDEERSYVSSLPVLLEMLRSGVTTTEDAHFTNQHERSVDGVLRAVRDVGMRCRMARLIVNDPETNLPVMLEDVDEGLAEVDRVRASWQSDTIEITTGTIGIAYLRMADLPKIFEWTTRHGSQFDIHAPSGGDIAHLAERGWSGGSFEYLDSVGMLGPSLLAGNAQLHMRPGEHDLVAKRGAKICLVPDSLTILGAAKFEAKAFVDRGVDMGLGLDGAVIAYHQNMWAAMRSIVTVQRVHDRADTGGDFTTRVPLWGSAELALELATIGGARALGMDERIGSLEVGKEADAVVIDMRDALHLSPRASLIQDLVYAGGATAAYVKDVFVAGRHVLADGRPPHVDVERAIRESNALQDVLFTELGLERFRRGDTAWTWVR